MRIDELFDQPLPLTWEKDDKSDGIVASFELNNVKFEVLFQPLFAVSSRSDSKIWTVIFFVSEKGDFKHDTILIFSTILRAVNEFFKREKVEELYFTASSNKLEKLYNLLMKYFNINSNYNVEKESGRYIVSK